MTVLSLRAGQDHLEKVASTRDPIKAISEFVWNAVDADATRVSVEFVLNVLGGIEEIVIGDNGTGISHAHAIRDFGNLGDSWKRTSHRTPALHRALHGKEGRGRLRFFSLAQQARWHSVYIENGKHHTISIDIASDTLEKSDLSEASDSTSAETGTVVTLTGLKSTYDWLLASKAFLEFNAVFTPYVLQYSNVAISYNGIAADPDATIARSQAFPTQTIVGPNKTVRDLSLRIIEWKSQVEDRKIHLGGESGITLGSQPANVVAPGFDFSAYAYAAYFQELADAALLELDDLS
ncbi:MAG: ATP-binding protein, partial [bacterium]